jgi:lysyl endopeptidase
VAAVHSRSSAAWCKRRGEILFIVVAGCLLAPLTAALAMMYEPPRSFALRDNSQEKVELKTLPGVNPERLVAEDRERGKNTPSPGPLRVAIPAETSYTLENSGTWQDLADGRLWRLRIRSPGALTMNLGMLRYEMPEGAKLWVYDPSHTTVDGPYTARNRSHLGSLFTPMVAGDTIVVEVYVPKGAAQPTIDIGRVNQGYRMLLKSGIFGQSEGTCENDVVCPIGAPWANEIHAIGLYTISGTDACTGNLMMDTAADFKPYVLSANHCSVDSTNDATIVFYWNFQSPTCSTHGPGSLAQNQTGATYDSSYAPSDFVLFELSSAPDPSFNAYWAGWNASGAAAASETGIHHPSADVKAISTSSNTTQGADWPSLAADPSGNHWRVDWTSGVTEPGSSGSCIFDDSNHECIGQLHGGPSACGLASSSEHDFYGKLAVSWNGGGTPATRLKDWLDPLNTGALSMAGDPHITTANAVHYDFQAAGEFVALRDAAAGLEIQNRQEPIATTFVPGADAHDGLETCVSINTAVAARVGKWRVTYEPNLDGKPDPTRLQLRIDGKLASLGPSGIDLGGGGRVTETAAPGGLQVTFPDSSALFVTPTWWASQGVWYLNIDVVRGNAAFGGRPGVGATAGGGVMGVIAEGTWLPALPNGVSLGAMPSTLPKRYATLYGVFAKAWRVNAANSLFDYAPHTSTNSFTVPGWPKQGGVCKLPGKKPVQPASVHVAEEACKGVEDKNAHKNCVFDVIATGDVGFARTYELAARVLEPLLAERRR